MPKLFRVFLSATLILGFAAPAAAETVRATANVPVHADDAVPAPARDPSLRPAVATDLGEVSIGSPATSGGPLFATLSAAVAAQPLPGAADDELTCLAGAVYFESHGEPLLGQLAVARVILNRTRSGRYPGSICGVVTQRSQFSFVHGGVVPTPPDGAPYRTALAIARIALTGQWADPSGGALAFHARRVSPHWAMTRVTAIGNHIFYR